MTALMPHPIKLGLIGDNITQSKSPKLHRAAGRLTGQEVTYDLLIPKAMGKTFDDMFETVRWSGYRGVNITYPYKERVTRKVTVADPHVRAIGAVNTVVFDPDGPKGFNTDYTGFISAYRSMRDMHNPGTVCLIGTGGVGKAIAFALVALNAKAIRCVDLDLSKANALADALRTLGTDTNIETFETATAAANGADGIINCTPLGMVGIGGSPLPSDAMAGASWAFDAVYTPVDTQLLQDAERAGSAVISGYELFFGQGVDAWKIFTGTQPDLAALRQAIENSD